VKKRKHAPEPITQRMYVYVLSRSEWRLVARNTESEPCLSIELIYYTT
jgi:hypothetical protein